MPRTLITGILAVILGSGAVLTVASVWMRIAGRHAKTPPVVLVCRETGEIFLGREPSVPQIHPETGRATLWPGLYCPQCDRWQPAPPMDRLYGKPEMMKCPACRSQRSFEGAVPEEAREL